MNSKKPTVMVVEDEHLLLKAIERKLKLNNLNVIACESGAEAWENLDKNQKPPDAIWLDYYLGDTNGIEFMQKLRNNEKWTDIPVLVVSNSANPDKVSKMMALGAKDYLLKADYRLDRLVLEIQSLINNTKTLKKDGQ